MATQSSILAWRIPWTVEPGRLYSSRGHKELDTTLLVCTEVCQFYQSFQKPGVLFCFNRFSLLFPVFNFTDFYSLICHHSFFLLRVYFALVFLVYVYV